MKPANGFSSPWHYWGSLAILVILSVADWDIQYVLFDLWGERYTLFLNQATAAVYIVISFSALLVLHIQQRRSAIVAANDDMPSVLLDDTQKRKPAPWYILVAIGLLNGSANFFQAISLPHTPGLTQTILNLLGVPLVLLMAMLFLRRRPSLVASAGAALIVAGTAFSSLRSYLQPDGSGDEPVVTYWWAILFFGVAQLFLAGEKVFEEAAFGRYATLAPMVMFCWTLVTQFLLGWAVYPIQTLVPGTNSSLAGLPDLLRDGARCAFGSAGADCYASATSKGYPARTPSVVFWVYCLVDFNTCALRPALSFSGLP